jgi:hypothetical protein
MCATKGLVNGNVCMQVQWANIFLLKVLHKLCVDVDQEEEDVDRFETMFTWTSRITLQTLRTTSPLT